METKKVFPDTKADVLDETSTIQSHLTVLSRSMTELWLKCMRNFAWLSVMWFAGGPDTISVYCSTGSWAGLLTWWDGSLQSSLQWDSFIIQHNQPLIGTELNLTQQQPACSINPIDKEGFWPRGEVVFHFCCKSLSPWIPPRYQCWCSVPAHQLNLCSFLRSLHSNNNKTSNPIVSYFADCFNQDSVSSLGCDNLSILKPCYNLIISRESNSIVDNVGRSLCEDDFSINCNSWKKLFKN